MENFNIVDAILNLSSLGIILYFVRRWSRQIDETMKNVVGKELCAERRVKLENDMDPLCQSNKRDHEKLWKHRHATSGEVILP
jgi:hypothetical protein